MSIIRVLPRAADEYARFRGLSVAAATDELLRIATAARPSQSDPERYRYRNRSDGLDVQLRVVNGCVLHVHARPYHSERGGQHNKGRDE